MAKQTGIKLDVPITLEEALELFDFEYIEGEWRVKQVKPNVRGDVSVIFHGTINGRKWEFIEKPERLLDATGDKMLIEVFNQLVESNAPHHHTGGQLMTEQNQITLKEALNLVHFKFIEGEWHVSVVRGDCDVVAGNCDTVKGRCNRVKGDCDLVEGDCLVVEGNCDIIGGSCIFVGDHVYGTINGRKWEYVETPKERLERLIEEGADKDQLLEAFNQLEDN